jgi:hypothetical protein
MDDANREDPARARLLPGCEDAVARAVDDAYSGDPERAGPAIHDVRAFVRHRLADAAAALGIPPDDPLLVERVAMEAVARARLHSLPAPPGGRPAKDTHNEARAVAAFVDAARVKNPGLSDSDVLRGAKFKARFPGMKLRTALRRLQEARSRAPVFLRQ